MAIRVANNKVQIGGSSEPFNGEVIDLQYSVNFSSNPSSITVTVANSSGEYDNPELNSENPLLIEFGSKKCKMLPVTYKKSKGSSGRTLSVEFDDMSLKYLDKTFVLLNHKHVSQLNLPRVIKLGQMFAEGETGSTGAIERYYGQYRSDTQVRYDIRELSDGIRKTGIPISKNLYEFLQEFKGYSLNGSDRVFQQSFMRSDTGAVRDVLSAIAGELGFVFFWNNADLPSETLNHKPYEGFLDFVKMKDDIDIHSINASIQNYIQNCNIEDDTEEVSIRGSYIKGAIGSFSASPSKIKTKSEPFARFRFMDKIYSPHTGETLDLHTANARYKYDLEMLMKASMVSTEFYKKFVLLKLMAKTFDVNHDSESVNKISRNLQGRNQKDNSGEQQNPDQRATEAIGHWFWDWKNVQEGDTFLFPLNITRNSVVELFYDFNIHPSVLSNAGEGNAKENSTFGKSILELINSENKFTESQRTPEKDRRWVASIMDINDSATKFLENTKDDHVYSKIRFLAENFGRYYYSVQRTDGFSVAGGESNNQRTYNPAVSAERLSLDGDFGGVDSDFGKVGSFRPDKGSFAEEAFTERPSLFTEKVFSERSYSNDGPTWHFSDIAVTDGPLSEIYLHVRKEDDNKTTKDLDYSMSDYHIVKNGQSQSSITVLPDNIASPIERWFTVDGYDNIISTYGFVRYFEAEQIKPVRSSTVGENENYKINSQSFLESNEYKNFKSETIGVTSSQSVPTTSNSDDWSPRGSTMPDQDAGSMPDASYSEINELRTDGENEIYTYPTDLDYGIILYDAYSDINLDKNPEINIDIAYHLFDSGENDDILADMKIDKQRIFAIETPVNKPTKIETKKGGWGEIYPDDIDKEAMKINLPFTLSEIRNRIRLNYSFNIDDLLVGVRCSYIPEKEFEKVTNIEIENQDFDIGELTNSINNSFPTEFPLRGSDSTEINIPLITDNLQEIMKLYVDENTAPSISRDFKVTGFGFGDDNEVPSIHEGLESLSITIGGQGVTTSIKIGNKRRTKESIDLRRSLLLRNLAGAKGGRLGINQVNKIFSNNLLSKF